MSNDPLMQPLQLKRLTLRNRLMISSHEPAYAEDGMPKGRYRAYHVERAKAGLALTMTAGSASVSRDSPPAFNNVLAYKDEVVPWMRALTEACHEHGAAVMIQLTHLGRRTRWDKGDWLPSLAPTQQREAAHRATPKLVEEWDLVRIKKDFADAAERMQAAGLDGLELESYGHLLSQFWSPTSNELADDYGGSLQNRMRFSLEVLAAIRERVGPDFLVGVRYAGDELAADGYGAAEGMRISQALKDSGLVDFLNITRGHIDTDAALTEVIPLMGMRSAPHLDNAGEVRDATRLPVFHAARIQDVATARHAIAAGKVDMIGMTRAHLADPHILRKILEGREGEIRPCVGATYCLDRIYQGGMAHCVHNPASGREETIPHIVARAEKRRKIVVVGAGPGGLEAARVAGERGHDVVVFEAAEQAGGQVRLTARTPRRREMMGIIDWRLAECERLGVALRYGVWADVETILAEAPDVVIVATGGLPDPAVLSSGGDLVVSAWDILSGDVKPGADVLVYDDAGDHAGLQAAEFIAASGARVEVMTRDRAFAPEVMGMNLTPYVRALQAREAKMTVTYLLQGVRRDGNHLLATIASDYSATTKTQRHDQIVVNAGTRPNADLYFELKPRSRNLGVVNYDFLIEGRPQPVGANPGGAFALYRIGDAVSARNTHAAIYDALRLVKDI